MIVKTCQHQSHYLLGGEIKSTVILKALYMFGNCQRPVFSLGVSHLNHRIISIGHRGCEKMMNEKTSLLDEFVCFQIGIKDFYM